MIIGIDASRANREHKTGTEWYSYYLIRWLAKLDDKNTYILFTDKPLRKGLLDLGTSQYFPTLNEAKTSFDHDGYQIIKSPFNNFKAKVLRWPFRYFWTQARLSIEMLFNRVDLLFVPAHTLPIIHPKKSMVTIHDIGFERESLLYQKEHIINRSGKTRWLLNLLISCLTLGKYKANNIDYLRWSTVYALNKATKIITVSNHSKDDLVSFYKTDPGKIAVIYNGYNRYIYQKVNDPVRLADVLKKYGISAPYFLYVGRIDKKKNIPALIEAFAMFRANNKDARHKLVLCGDASYGYDETKYMVEEFCLENEVIMTGWLPEEELPCLFSAATAFIFPSIYEGFGIPLLQAMACGVPIAASNTTSIPEIVGEAAALFDPNNIQQMSKVIAAVAFNNDLRQSLIDKSAVRIKNFSWEKCARGTLEEINRLFAKN